MFVKDETTTKYINTVINTFLNKSINHPVTLLFIKVRSFMFNVFHHRTNPRYSKVKNLIKTTVLINSMKVSQL